MAKPRTKLGVRPPFRSLDCLQEKKNSERIRFHIDHFSITRRELIVNRAEVTPRLA